MKFKVLFGIALFSINVYAEAGCVGTVINGKCIGTYIDAPNVGSGLSGNSGHKSSTGTRYQYDLSDPSDRLDHSIDLNAQLRDQMSVNPNRSLDRGMGEFGGGIYDD